MRLADLSPSVLTIAGSDSGAAAGIQADLKTFAAHGVHGLTAITAITAQNTRAITATRVLPALSVLAQLDAVFADFRIAAVKIGMLGSAANVRLVTSWLHERGLRNIVLDPVLVASSGRLLLPPAALAALRGKLLPLAQLLTPNVPEAEALLGRSIHGPADLHDAAQELRSLGADSVLLKGGHLHGSATVRDCFVDNAGQLEFTHRRRKYSVRGTGCTLASAAAANLALGLPMRDAVARAEQYLQQAFRLARRTGRGTSRILHHIEGDPDSTGRGHH